MKDKNHKKAVKLLLTTSLALESATRLMVLGSAQINLDLCAKTHAFNSLFAMFKKSFNDFYLHLKPSSARTRVCVCLCSVLHAAYVYIALSPCLARRFWARAQQVASLPVLWNMYSVFVCFSSIESVVFVNYIPGFMSIQIYSFQM